MPSPTNIAHNQIYSSLLQRGYFPEKIPPIFSTQDLMPALNVSQSHPFLTDKIANDSELLVHDAPNRGIRRRVFSVANPIWHARTANEIANGWNLIASKLNTGNISISRPIICANRAFKREHELRELDEFRLHVRANARFVLQTDISRFYPSIYTHSIPWALHEKSVAKKDRGQGLLGNRIDQRIQLGQYGQTLGIPIGPDTSYIIGELILSSFDSELDPMTHGFRYVDDMEFGFRTRDQAEKMLKFIRLKLHDFGLRLNDEKTRILELPQPILEPWVTQIRTRNLGMIKGKVGLLDYFNYALDLAKAFPEQPILKYAISPLSDKEYKSLRRDHWKLIQAFVCHCVSVQPSTITKMVEVTGIAEDEGLIPDAQLTQRVINATIIDSCKAGYSNEVLWLLWIALKWKIKIEDETRMHLEDIEDSFVVLLVLLAQELGLLNALSVSKWATYSKPSALYSQQWLLAYEAPQHGWRLAKHHQSIVINDPYYSLLQRCNVEFFKADMFDETPILPDHDFDEYGGFSSQFFN